jgi:cytochrome c oxidase cbb3-type subunit III
MAVNERDDYSGYMTTGHEWNGIRELNSPVPRPIYFFLAIMFAVSVILWILAPAWPLGVTYTKGLLGLDQRKTVEESLAQAARDRDVWTKHFETMSFKEIQAEPNLMAIVREWGHTLFGDNCAACHGIDLRGDGKHFPNLTTPAWLWGGDPETIAETIRVGINSSHPDSRVSQMPAFGRDQILKRGDIEKVVAYVRTLSDPSAAKDAPPGEIAAGKAIFAANCVACHGDDGRGKTDVGAPDLTDEFWIYGGDPHAIFTTVWGGRQGHMPTWESRLSPVERKILALYVFDHRAAEQ